MTEPKPITADQVIAKYISDRDKIAELNKQISGIKVLQEKRENWLATKMDRDQEKGVKTIHGSCNFYHLASATVSDAAAFREWVIANEAFDFFTNAVAKGAVETRIEEGEPLPPGVNYGKTRKVKVVRPKGGKNEE